MSPTALVTGTSSGIGAAIAADLLAAGWRVVGLSRRAGVEASEGFTHLGCDLADPASVTAAVAGVRALAPRLDAVVHAAGVQYSGRLGSLAHEGSERMWRIHVDAAQRLVDGLVESLDDGGRIVLLGSRTAVGVAGKSQYGATKAALGALCRAWASELAPRRITVNIVAPGPTRTPMLADPRRSATPVIAPPLGRLVEPPEVAGLVRFLLEPGGAMITGQTLVMCGGASLA